MVAAPFWRGQGANGDSEVGDIQAQPAHYRTWDQALPVSFDGVRTCSMKCPKCRYTSFPYLETCPKCAAVLEEQRAALGIYAMRPDPPDLWLAYQAVNMEAAGGLLSTTLPPRGLELAPLRGIELEVSQMGLAGVETDELEELRRAPEEPDGDRRSPKDMPRDLGMEALGEITLALEHEADPAAVSPPGLVQAPEERTDAPHVYDLDVDETLGSLTLGQIVEASGAGEDEDDAAVVEYTLEIEEDLEFDVEGLTLEQDEEGADDDDDDR
jgi:hypothetical protein